MDTNKKFEDQLRERLISEELPFDPAAWESFESQYPSTDTLTPTSEQKNRKRTTLWIAPLLLLLCLVAYDFAWKSASESKNESTSFVTDTRQPINIASQSQKQGETISQKEQSQTIIKKENKIASERQSDTKQTKSNLELNVQKQAQTTLATGSMIRPIATDEESTVQDASQTQDSRENTKSGNSSSYSQTLSNKVSTNKTEIIQYSNNKSGQIESVLTAPVDLNDELIDLSLETPEIVQTKTQFSQTTATLSVPKSSSISSEGATISPPLRNILTTANIASLQGEVAANSNRLKDYNSDNLTIPFKFKRNEFFMGLGFNYGLNSQKEVITNSAIDQAEPNTLQLGYERRLDLRWSVGIGATFTGLRNIDLKVTREDYHLTSIAFEFVEATTRHSTSAYIEIPLYLKYNPLGKRYSLFAGGKASYALFHTTSTTNISNGTTNPIIEQIKESRDYSQYLNTYDFAIFFGGRYRFWKNLELDAQIRQGLTDISNNSFWGESNDTSSSISVGINYKFNW